MCEGALGKDYQIVEIGFDVPFQGAKYQPWHRDFPSPVDTYRDRRITSLAFNLTGVDVTQDMGPFEVAPGTQYLDGRSWKHEMFPEKDIWPQFQEKGVRKFPELGDISCRSALTVHRGTEHLSPIARPVMVLGVDAPGAGHAELHDLMVTQNYFDALPDSVKQHLVCRVVDKLVPVTQKHDIEGLVYDGRNVLMDPWKEIYAQKSDKRVLAESIGGADVFLGLSAAGVLKPELLEQMAAKPLIMALANPTPEIMPELARAARPDAMICTGRSDFPNQVNNVLCFPYIFRGALDCGATTINEEMKMAAVRAIAALAREEVSEVAARAYTGETPTFGPDYLIPSPFDPRLILRIAPAVAKAAADSGVARRPIADFDTYLDQLNRFVFRSGFVMKPIFAAAKTASNKRVIFAEGEDERVLRAAQVLLEDGIGEPILIGRPQIIETRLKRYGLRIRPGTDFELVNPEDDPRYRDYVDDYFALVGRAGINPEAARTIVRTNTTVIGALAVKRGDADALICGVEGRYDRHVRDVRQIIGKREGVRDFSGLSLLISQRGAIFFTDTFVTDDPCAEEIAEMTILAAQEIRRFGISPKAALLSHSNFGSRPSASASKMRQALEIIRTNAPDIEVDGEMQGGSALSEVLRKRAMPESTLTGEANLLVFPNLDAANISLGIVRTMMDALHVGPILLGAAMPAHVLSTSVTSRGVVNMAALAVVEASQPAG